jgi:hypothetical protein
MERKAVLVKFPLPEFEAIEAARGDQDRSSWIRARLAEAVARTAPVPSEPAVGLLKTDAAATIRRW